MALPDDDCKCLTVAWDVDVCANLPLNFDPPVFKVTRDTPNVVSTLAKTCGFSVKSHTTNFTATWGKRVPPETYAAMRPGMKMNHFPDSFNLGKKDVLFANLNEAIRRIGAEKYPFIPRTRILPDQRRALAREMDRKGLPWIIKPGDSRAGQGITVVSDSRCLPVGSRPYVAQRYVDNPLLIDGYKFDLRLYIVVTSYNPLMVYFYEEGLVRFATHKYSADPRSFSDPLVHLTNYSIQKHSSTYKLTSSLSSGSKWSVSALKKYFMTAGIDDSDLWTQIEQLIVKTLIAVEGKMSKACQRYRVLRSSCFEMYGFDVLVDDALQPFLLEVNVSPSMDTRSDMDRELKSKLVADTLNLACLQVYSTPPSRRSTKMSENERERRRLFMDSSLEERLEMLHTMGAGERAIVARLLLEASMCGPESGFTRVFPTETTASSGEYVCLFETVRHADLVLWTWLLSRFVSLAEIPPVPKLAPPAKKRDRNRPYTAMPGGRPVRGDSVIATSHMRFAYSVDRSTDRRESVDALERYSRSRRNNKSACRSHAVP